ncbi:MAG TPA: DNA polymerase III subunit gamma/tau [Candidatus Saccharimonadales bacterium]|nr:DNA polymerase III subunit gamma/tau [Candidatus Saccharimonadales bacterium]
MGQALYRKYRSKSLSEIVGQEHITSTLGKAIKSGRISHAYLFTGPRGVGKTSIARILAHEINELPYTDESAHLDIIEIDAASNRRIDEIRELREKVYVAPSSAKYKVYIIDEVHMLTREAFNALLKTLEEPPAHVVFILATTDAHKLPDTIISRTQRFAFRPVEKAKVVEHLKHIAQKEKIKISDEALELLAEHGEGSFRDSISLLDQASNHGKSIGIIEVRSLLGIPSAESIEQIINALETANTALIMQVLVGLYDQGFQAAGIAKQLALKLRQEIGAAQQRLSPQHILDILAKLIEVPASHDPERYLEIVLLAQSTPVATMVAQPAPPVTTITPVTKAEPKVVENAKKKELIAEDNTQASADEPEPAHETTTEQPIATGTFDLTAWPEVLAALKKKHNTVYSIARMGQPSLGSDGQLVLAFAFAFHQKRVNEAKNRKMLLDTIQELTGQTIHLECTFDKELAQRPVPSPSQAVAEPALNTISNIFGGGELLES